MATRQRRFTKRNALEMIAAAIANVTARQSHSGDVHAVSDEGLQAMKRATEAANKILRRIVRAIAAAHGDPTKIAWPK